uniref:Four helix bundle protein n=1 Tax=Prevotella sp. GTC17262 TaxID=3236797 RepID=A0AB33JKH9_9BACT
MSIYKDLLVWQKSMALAQRIYEITVSFPVEERFGFTSQIRRYAVSIPSNIAEGYGRESAREHIHFLYISLGSSNELDTQLILAQQLRLIDNEVGNQLIHQNEEVNKMLSSLIYTLKH